MKRDGIDSEVGPDDSYSKLHLLDVFHTLYLWYVFILFYGLANLRPVHLSESCFLAIVGSLVISGFGLLLNFFSRTKILVDLVVGLTFAFAITAPTLFVELEGRNDLLLIDLYYILIIITPTLLCIWSWRAQASAGLLALGSIFYMHSHLPTVSLVKSTILVCSAAILSFLVLYLRRNRSRYSDPDICHYLLDRLGEYEPARLRSRFWNVSLVQAGFVLVFILLEGGFQQSVDIERTEILLKIYAIVCLIFGNLSLSLVKSSYISTIIFLTEVVVSLLFICSLSLTSGLDVVHFSLPILALGLTTVSLGWSFKRQVVFSWFLSFAAFFVPLLVLWRGAGSLQDSQYYLLENKGVLNLVVLGIAVVVFIGKTLRRASWEKAVEMSHFSGSTSNTLVVNKKALESGLKSGLDQETVDRMIKTLFALVIVSCFLSTILIVGSDSSLWGLAGLGWIVSMIAWAVLRFFSIQKPRLGEEHIWFAGSILTIVLVVWPTALIVNGSIGSPVWTLWALLPIVGIGFIPWRLSELVPIFSVGVVSGIEVLERVGFASGPVLYFSLVGVLSLVASQIGSQRLRQNYLIRHLPESLAKSSSLSELYIILCDALQGYFQISDSFLSEDEDSLMLLRNNFSYGLNVDEWSPRKMFLSRPYEKFSDSETYFRIFNWIPSGMEFFHPELGMFSSPHGFCLSLKSSHSRNGLFDKSDEKKGDVLIFVPFKWPFIKICRKIEIDFVRAVSSLVHLRADTLRQRESFQSLIASSNVAKKGREYELSAMVHDINNTVQDLTVLCESLSDDLFGRDSDEKAEELSEEELGERINRISVIARSMATVVSDAKRKRELEGLVDLSPKELVNVSPVLDEIVSFSRIRAERKRIGVEYSRTIGDQWVKVSAREHFGTIIRNLLNNAILYSDPGSSIFVRILLEAGMVRIEIEDDGSGLHEEELERIFITGIRGSSGDDVPGGLGIGLSQSRRIAEAAGGSLKALSEGAGKGSIFVLELPAHLKDEDSGNSAKYALLVDDQNSFVHYYSRIANALGLEPRTANSYDEAESIIETSGRPYFVLTDLHLGNSTQSGFDLVKLIRKKYGDILPILVVSGLPDEDVDQKVKEAGATDFVPKPIGRKALFSRIESLLNQLENI